MAAAQGLDVDLTDPDLYRQGFPHELFSDLRARGPVHRHRRVHVPQHHADIEFWAVVAHAEVQHANRDWEVFSAADGPSIVPTVPERRRAMIVSLDPPDHTRMRRLISAGFTPRMIARLDDLIERRTARILDAVAGRDDVEFVSEVAYQLPMHVIADIVGIPESDRPAVFTLTDAMIRGADPAQGIPAERRREVELELFAYASALSRSKREHPADDVWTIIAHAELPHGDGGTTALTELELDMFFLILSLAGSETTRNALSQGILELVDHPDQWAALHDDPAGVPRAVDEVLRWSSPVVCFGRTVTTDVELGGQALAAGDRIGLFYPSANRDAAVFDDPFRFDTRRHPNPHVAFGGGGPHFCLGASLARTEVAVMLRALAHRYERVEVTAPPTWVAAGPVNNVGVAVDRLPVRLVPR